MPPLLRHLLSLLEATGLTFICESMQQACGPEAGYTAQKRCCLTIGSSIARTHRANLHLQGGRHASGWGTGL